MFAHTFQISTTKVWFTFAMGHHISLTSYFVAIVYVQYTLAKLSLYYWKHCVWWI